MPLFKNRDERYTLARNLILILRELPVELDLQVDNYGYASIPNLLAKLTATYPDITIDHIMEIAQKDAQKRFEISGGKIRAKTGHRYYVKLPSDTVKPPEFLYHGTSGEAAMEILKTGILKMGKAYVHLTNTPERARRIGFRKSSNPKILKVHAKKAFDANIQFWKSGQVAPDGEIYLSNEIPPGFVSCTNENVSKEQAERSPRNNQRKR